VSGTLSPRPEPTLEFEEIRAIRFSRLREVPSQRQNLPLLGWQFLTVSLVSILALFGAARYILDEIERGNDLPLRIFGIFIMAVLYVAPIVALVMTRLKRKDQEVMRAGVYPAAVSVKSGDSSNCRAKGELVIRGPWLEFSGDAFSFRLTPRDFEKPAKLARRIRNRAVSRLTLPKGLPSLSIFIGFQMSPAEVRRLHEELTSRFEAWANAADPSEPSLFPPLRAAHLGHSPGTYALRLLPASLIVGIACAAAPLLLPEMADGKANPALLGLCAFSMIQMLSLSVALEVWRRKQHNAKVEKL
jgi:hypothetical protein